MRQGRAMITKRIAGYREGLEYLDGRMSAPIGHNTTVVRRDDAVAIVYLGTEIVTFHSDERISLNSGGWRTVTTLHRMNAVLPVGLTVEGSTVSGWTGKRPANYREWRVFTPSDTFDFYDGISVFNV